MNIKEFVAGDIITRNEACAYGSDGHKDGSWCGDRLILKGHDEASKIIFIEHTENPLKNDITTLSYARDDWNEGWSLYPENLWKQITNTISKLVK